MIEVFLAALITIVVGWLFFSKKRKKRLRYAQRQKKTLQNTTQDSPPERTFKFNTSQSSGREAALIKPPAATDAALETLNQRMQNIPSIPPIWNEIQTAIERGVGAKDVAKIVMRDPGLGAEVLKSANSAAFGTGKEINDIGQAIVRLGFHSVRAIASSYCLTPSADRGWDRPFDLKQLWKHAMTVSTLSTVVARHIPACNAGIAGTIGLLHDIGRVGLNAMTQERFRNHESRINQHPTSEQGFLNFEHDHFGCTHVESGTMLARHWMLPETVQLGIAYHHHPAFAAAQEIPKSIRKEVLAVYLADLLAIHFGCDGGNRHIVVPHESYASMMSSSLQEIEGSQAVSKEMWRINAVEI